ncbi:MAG: amidohydrolase family protein [Dehalococcoidia bacterium]
MGRFGYEVIDADGHVFETPAMYDLLCREYLPVEHSRALASLMERARRHYGTEAIATSQIWGVEGTVPLLARDRPLGPASETERVHHPSQGAKDGTEAARDMLDPHGRLRDMDREGIDVSVIYPSSLASFCALEDQALETAIYQAYNRWCADFCAADPKRLKFVAVFSMRDVEAGVAEAHRAAGDATTLGLYCQTHMGDRQLDQPFFDPIWNAAQDLDLPTVIHHASAALPPYGLGVFDMNGNWWLAHAASNPFEQMRAIATMLGGGVFQRFPELRAVYLEAGCGWLPYWLDRLDHHLELMPYAVPLMKQTATELFASGRCFVSFDPDEQMLPHTVKHVGDDVLVFASDYPHFDGAFPDSVRLVAQRDDITEASKRKLLAENARRLYPRLG